MALGSRWTSPQFAVYVGFLLARWQVFRRVSCSMFLFVVLAFLTWSFSAPSVPYSLNSTSSCFFHSSPICSRCLLFISVVLNWKLGILLIRNLSSSLRSVPSLVCPIPQPSLGRQHRRIFFGTQSRDTFPTSTPYTAATISHLPSSNPNPSLMPISLSVGPLHIPGLIQASLYPPSASVLLSFLNLDFSSPISHLSRISPSTTQTHIP